MSLVEIEQGYQIDHQFATHTLAKIRREDADHRTVREGMSTLGRLCGYEIMDQLMEAEPTVVETPLAETEESLVTDRDHVVLVSLLRGSLPFVDGLREAFPNARDAMIRPEREREETDEDGQFPMTVDYAKLPDITERDTVIVADPMMATGSSVCTSLAPVIEKQPNPKELVVLTTITVSDAMEHVAESYPEATCVTVAIDDRLESESGYIVPGLGDAGDRAFGTASRRIRMKTSGQSR